MDSGSWFAIWAMWRRISFFVITPRRRLQKERQKEGEKFKTCAFLTSAKRTDILFCCQVLQEGPDEIFLYNSILRDTSQTESNLLLWFLMTPTSALATDSWQSLVWRRAESVEDYAVLLRAGNATLFLWADSTYTVRSKCFAKQKWNRVSERLHLIHTLWPWWNKKVKLIFQHKFKSIFKGCADVVHFVSSQCWGTPLEKYYCNMTSFALHRVIHNTYNISK